MRNSQTIIPFPERIIGEERQKQIDEEPENEEEEPGNVSETGSVEGRERKAEIPTNLTSPRTMVKINDKLMINMSYHPPTNTTGEHTRSNSSKAQSLKGSIILQKPNNYS